MAPGAPIVPYQTVAAGEFSLCTESPDFGDAGADDDGVDCGDNSSELSLTSFFAAGRFILPCCRALARGLAFAFGVRCFVVFVLALALALDLDGVALALALALDLDGVAFRFGSTSAPPDGSC